jgi:dGTPase
VELSQLSKISIFARHLEEVQSCYPDLSGRRVIHETVRRMINTLILDLVSQSQQNIEEAGVRSIDDVRNHPPLIAFSPKIRDEQRELKQFLRTHLYRHYRVARMSAKAHRIIRELFAAFMDDPRLLPPQYKDKADQDKARTISDYIAGMTDRYAIKEYRRLFTVEEI